MESSLNHSDLNLSKLCDSSKLSPLNKDSQKNVSDFQLLLKMWESGEDHDKIKLKLEEYMARSEFTET